LVKLVLILPELRTELGARGRDLQNALDYARAASHEPSPVCPDLASLAAELRQLEDEFGALTVDRKTGSLVVVTEPITLEGIDLGPFTIRFRWKRLRYECGAGCFDVVALTPNPASTKENVMHPHVQDEALCAGEAAA